VQGIYYRFLEGMCEDRASAAGEQEEEDKSAVDDRCHAKGQARVVLMYKKGGRVD
jgi:hypothetical protein